MVSTLRLVIGIVILDKLRCILRQRVNHTTGKGVTAVFIVLRALGVHGLFLFVAGIAGILTVKISVGVHTGHIVHGRCHSSLDAGIHSSGIDGHAAPAANADDTDALRVNSFLYRKEIHCRTEILCVDVRGSHIPGTAAAFAGKGRVKSNGQETKFRHLLRVQPGGLLFHCAKGTADRNGRKLAGGIFRYIHIRYKGNSVAVMK